MAQNAFNIDKQSLEYRRKLKIAEDLFNFAYEVKSYQLKKKHPSASNAEIHQMTMELIERGRS